MFWFVLGCGGLAWEAGNRKRARARAAAALALAKATCSTHLLTMLGGFRVAWNMKYAKNVSTSA